VLFITSVNAWIVLGASCKAADRIQDLGEALD